MQILRIAAPLVSWLTGNVGPTDDPLGAGPRR
jgi:hypothetical protein